jgi:hypothetical protein
MTKLSGLVAAMMVLAGLLSNAADAGDARGKVTFLRVNQKGVGYGGGIHHIDVEVVIKLEGKPDNAFGLTLRDDDGLRTQNHAMLDLLRDAFNSGLSVTIYFDDFPPGKLNTIIRIVELTK